MCCPVKKVNINKKCIDKPWFSPGLKNACKKKNCLYKSYLQTKSKAVLQKYKKYKNKLVSILRNEEKRYYSTVVKNSHSDIKQTWKVMKKLINKNKSTTAFPGKFKCNNQIVTSKKEICNEFNRFFTNVGPELAKGIKTPENCDIYETMGDSNSQSVFLENVTEFELLKLAKNCRNKHSTDCDDLSMYVVRATFASVLKPFKYICNLSLKSGIFPDGMKVAKVIPLFKSGDDELYNNYRPVSLLPQFSKILEKVFEKRLDSFINKYNILSNSQYGFRNNRSTALALIDLIENITSAIDKRKVTIGVFIDLKKGL